MGDWDDAVRLGLEDLQGNLLVDDYDDEPEAARHNLETIEIELTPTKYLDSNSRYLRAQLTNNNLQSDQVVLELFHDKYNDHDPMAIEVYCDKTFIGYVKKKGAEEDADNFCFSEGTVLRDLTLEWKDTYFQLTRETPFSSDSIELSISAPYESRSIQKLWNWADQNNLSESEFPRNHEDLIELTALEIGKEDLDDIPHEIGCLQNLVKLTIWSNKIKRVPSSIGNLKELNELTIEGDKLRKLPSEIGKLDKLTRLKVCGKNFVEFPSHICRLRYLTELIFLQTNIDLLPLALSNLSKLKLLIINGSKLDSTVDFSWLAYLTELEKLSLKTNELTSIPKEIFDLHKLKLLEICETKISEIPDSIGNLTNLVELVISYNPGLKTLPDSIDGLINLASLKAFSTPLETIPESIVNLTNIKLLRFAGGIELPDWYWEWEEKYEINMMAINGY